MNQQIAPSVTSQTASTALKTANGHDKPAGKGIFAKLVAMIEGKAETDNDTGSEKAGTSLAEMPIAKSTISKTDKADANVFSVIKSDVQKAKLEQADSSGAIMVNSGLTVSKNNHKLLTAIEPAAINAKAEAKHAAANREASSFTVKANPAADGKEPSLTVKANTDQPVKVRVGAEIKQTTANPAADGKEPSLTVKANTDQPVQAKAGAEIKQAAANPAADGKEPSLTVKANADQPVKTGAGAEIKQAAANPAADGKEPALTVRANVDQPVKTGAEAEIKQAAANPAADGKEPALTVRTNTDQPVKAKAGPEIKQAAANPATGGEKPAVTLRQVDNISSVTKNGHIAIANEQRIAGMQPEQHSLSTNNFVHSHKLNSDNLSKPKAQLSQASPGKNPVTSADNNKNPSIQPATPLASSMRDMIFQVDALSRPNQPLHEASNNQAFQASSLDTASTLMRSISQPLQSMPTSGPWPVTAAMQQIGHAAGQGKFQLELTLTPAHLGKVQVILESDANKQIHVHLIIDQPASRQPIEQHLPALRQALADQGLNMDSFSMESSEQHTDKQQNQKNRNAPSSAVIADSSGTVVKRADLPSDSRLSIRI
jgi:flagellar hook-length control protein FliK